MLDSCGCCKVCARQLFEDCSRTQPCDHTKGLECNFGGGFGSDKGICRGTVTSVLSFLSVFFFFLIHLLTLHVPVPLKQLNQMGEPASTTTRFTRTGRSSVQTANTSAPAWTVLLDASPCVHVSSRCPDWAVPNPDGSRYRDAAVNNLSAPGKQSQKAQQGRSTGKRMAKTEHLKTTSPTQMNWLLGGEESL